MKISFVSMLAVCLIAIFSCHRNPPVFAAREHRQDACERKTPEECWQLAQNLEETGDPNMLLVLENACSKGSVPACSRFLDEAELTLLPSPGAAAAWKPRLEAFCARRDARACRLLDLVHLLEPGSDPERMKKAFFNRLEACRKDASHCVSLMQAIFVMERKNAAFFKANALLSLQTACEGGAAEACHHEALLQAEKRDLKWTLPFLMRACSLGETAGCSKLVNFSIRALLENMPRYTDSEPFLQQACFELDFGTACLVWAKGHVHKIWTKANPAAGRDEYLRQCRLGDNEACTEFARFLLREEPGQRDWALQILRQTCSDSYQNACVEWILAMEKGSPEEQRNALLQARASCLGPSGSSSPQPQYEYEYMQYGRTSFYNNPTCTLYARMIREGREPGVSSASSLSILTQSCSSLVHPVCLYYGQKMFEDPNTTASALTSLYERICKAGYAEACLEMAALQRRGFKELKPNEAAAREYTALACRLDPRLPACSSPK